ncbi:MAG: DNA mismatch repair endonuclease MutL [Acidobacteriota bacterium]
MTAGKQKIRILPPGLSVKIAAGEVIECPGSVVKELVENALDAEATDIRVVLLEGGKGSIQVTDNGLGMSPEDAGLCFERHSTSKIQTDEDLNAIATLGFRGEALASISSVSRMTLQTGTGEDGNGTRIRREGEKVRETCTVAFPRGTSLVVRDLFFNLPARKKFLRTDRAELSRIVKTLTHCALAHPDVGFSLTHDGRQTFHYPVVQTLKERLFQIYGKETLANLAEVDFSAGDLAVKGYVSVPPKGRRDRKRQIFFVNGRPVRDKTLQAAFSQAYRGYLEKDQFAEGYLFLTVPLSEVDVNVHPAKSEVRFRDNRAVFQLIFHGVEQVVLRSLGLKEIYSPSGDPSPKHWISEKKRPPSPSQSANGLTFPHESAPPGGRRVLGQHNQAYIIAVDEDGLLIIDQHNAHERVLFERFAAVDREKKWPRKMALLSLLFELTPSQELALQDILPLLEGMGFRVEPMGGRSCALREYPDMIGESEARDIFLSLLEDPGEKDLAKQREHLLATMACKAAVKYGEFLSREKMEYLTEQLFLTENPALCPHGRPIVIRISNREIEKSLKR